MGVYFWQHELKPEFPICILDHPTYGNQAHIHWHNYLQISLILEIEVTQRQRDTNPSELSTKNWLHPWIGATRITILS
jgi:hypothetical protein